MSTTRLLGAEFLGTFVLMLGGPGTAILAGDRVGVLGVSLGFGLALVAAAALIGPISGCHINPAVTIGLTVAGKLERPLIPYYVGGQLLGALLGGFAIWLVRTGAYDGFEASPASFATNLWGAEHGRSNFGAMVVVEVVLTAVLVLVVLATTRRGFAPATTGVTVGLTLTLIHLISIPVDNTSVNPARSFGTALYAGGAAIEQLWAFLVFPAFGAALGALVWRGLEGTESGHAAATWASDEVVVDLTEAAAAERAAAIEAMPPPEGTPVRVGDGDTGRRASVAVAGSGTVKLRHPFGPGSHAVLDDPQAVPEGYPLKGDVSTMRFHGPDAADYDAVVASVWFDDAESALGAGFSPVDDPGSY